MYRINTIRGTIFCPFIKYTKDFVAQLNTILNDYLPVLFRDGNMMQTLTTWQLISPDEKEVLLFNENKIDLVRIIESEIGDVEVSDFSNHCKEVFGKIMEIYSYSCSRLALAPTVVVTEGGDRPDALYQRLFGLNEFQQSRPEISNVSQVFRVSKRIGGKEIKINHVANFHVENDVININGKNQLRERYICDFDINTMVNPEYRFGDSDMKEFFDVSSKNFKDYYCLYFEN